MSGPQIRRLGAADWRLLADMRLRALADAPEAFSSTLADEQDLGEQAWRSRLAHAAYFAAWCDGEPAGLAAGLADAGDPAGPHLVSMWVRPVSRGQGLAFVLVEAVAAWAREQGSAALLLWVTEVNPRAAACYRRAGFRATGERQLVRPQEPGHWEAKMVRDLA